MNPRLHLVTTLAALTLSGCAADPSDVIPTAAVPEEVAFDWLVSAGGLAAPVATADLQTVRVSGTRVGTTHVRVQQTLGGVPVLGGQVIVHVGADGRVVDATDALVPAPSVDTVPTLDQQSAVALATTAAFPPGTAPTREPVAALWVWRGETGDHLVWRVQLHHQVGGDDTLPLVFLDAHSGEILRSSDNLQSATCSGTTPWDGVVSFECTRTPTGYVLEDRVEQIGTWSFEHARRDRELESVTSPTPTFAADPIHSSAVGAQWAAARVMDYYLGTFERDGIDGQGGPDATVSHGLGFTTSTTSYGRAYNNAYWDGERMVFGDGDGELFGSMVMLDLAAHEFTHGVVETEAGLIYEGESGALNESFADVFGAMVERDVYGESADTWTFAEDAFTPDLAGDAARYMADPTADGSSTSHYSERYLGREDNGGVHWNSGIGNLAFYLVAEGGPHPDGLSQVVVTGIGADAAAEIWYLALTGYLTPTSGFADARIATASAAAELFGACSAETRAVVDAWASVGVGRAMDAGACP